GQQPAGSWPARHLVSQFRNWLHRPVLVALCAEADCSARSPAGVWPWPGTRSGAGSGVKRIGSAVRPGVEGPGRHGGLFAGTAAGMSGIRWRRCSTAAMVTWRAGSFEGQACGPALQARWERLLPDCRAAARLGLLFAAAKLTMM